MVVHMVKTLGKLPCHFEVLLLIFSNGDKIGFVNDNVGGHQHWIGKQAGIHVVGLHARLVFERGCPLQFSQVGIHIQESVKFRDFGYIALNENSGSLRINTAGQIFGQHMPDTRLKVFGRRMGSQGMYVSNKKVAVVIILHFHKAPHCTKIVAQVQVTGWPDTAYHSFLHIV